MPELLCHLGGDYVLQNQWMADNKVRAWWPAIVHAAIYTAVFLTITNSPLALAIIFSTHAIIDRFRLAKYWTTFYGIGKGVPDWLSVWLLIIVDNTFHLTINHLALTYT